MIGLASSNPITGARERFSGPRTISSLSAILVDESDKRECNVDLDTQRAVGGELT